MPETEKLSETYDMYDEFDCEVEERAKTMKIKEEEDSETDYDVLKSDDDQSAGNGKWIIDFTLTHFTFI